MVGTLNNTGTFLIFGYFKIVFGYLHTWIFWILRDILIFRYFWLFLIFGYFGYSMVCGIRVY